jgi:hypothetical protein
MQGECTLAGFEPCMEPVINNKVKIFKSLADVYAFTNEWLVITK